MDLRKGLILSTAAAALLALIFIVRVSFFTHPFVEGSGPVFESENASVEVILFEDLKCHGCRTFSKEVLPHIESDYLAQNKIRLKIILLGFLPGSEVLANAALEVYKLVPEAFFPFVNKIFEQSMEESISKNLLEIAQEIGGIDLEQLQSCIDQKCHYPEIDQNLVKAKALMGKKFRIPAVYVNGVRVKTTDYPSIRQNIEKKL